MLKKQVELIKKELRKKLNTYAAMYGTLDPRTLEISMEVDKVIFEEMKEIQKRKRILCKGFN